MRKTVLICLKIVVGMLLTMLINGCGSKKETAVVSTTSPSAVYAHSVAFRNNTTVSWGANNTDQLGNNITTGATQPSPQPVVGGVLGTATLNGMTGVSAGGTHTLAFIDGGNVYAWGNNGSDQLGNNNNKTISAAPVLVISDTTTTPVTFLTGIKAVSAGMSHSLARDSFNNVWAWGDNTYGQLGPTQTTTASRPFAATVNISALSPIPLSNITRIAAGLVHNLALTGSGTVLSWGYNGSGQLGYKTTDPTSPSPGLVTQQAVNPVNVGSTLSNVAEIAAGNSYSLFRLTDGTVWACGYNLYGQLGDATIIDRKNGAVKVSGLPASIPVTQIAAGLAHSLALINGEVWAWGLNFNGQLGNGQPLLSAAANSIPATVMVNAPTPTPLSGVTKIIAIGNHNLALKNDGTLWTWGENFSSQLGLGAGDTTDRNFAVQVTGSTNWDLYIQQ